MTSLALRPSLQRLRRRRVLRRRRRRRADVSAELVSVAGVVGSPVVDASGKRIGRLHDLVVQWGAGDAHPALHGALVRVRHTTTFLPVAAIVDLMADRLEAAGPLISIPAGRPVGLVALAHDVLDRQVVDVDGADVDRISDLLLARLPDGFHLVGADVSARTLLRRLGPPSLRRRVASDRIYDWASVAAFSVRQPGEAGSVLQLTDAAERLRELGPADLHLLLQDLPPHERAQIDRRMGGGPAP